jgi:hypothetical protein
LRRLGEKSSEIQLFGEQRGVFEPVFGEAKKILAKAPFLCFFLWVSKERKEK